MPYEFLAKNGLISQGNITATGSLTVTQNISASRTGSFGAVAIGTNNLQDSLTIGSSISESLLIQNNTYNNLSNGIQITSNLGFLNGASANLNFARWTGTDSTDHATIGQSFNVSSWDLQFSTGRQNTGSAINYFTSSAVRMTIKAVTGNVGIGTTSPVNKLQVEGNISGSSFTSSISNAVGFLGTSSWAQNVISASYVLSSSFATTAQTANALNPANSYTIAGLTNNGTLSQQGTLSMGSAYQLFATTGTAGAPGISFVGDSNTGIYSPGSDTIGFSISGSERMRIASDGNVGIGTTSPLLKLDVRGALQVAGGADGIYISNVGDNSAYDNVKLYYTGYNSGSPRIYLTPRTQPGSGNLNTYLYLQSNVAGGPGSNTMGLLVDGNVGIGTTSPTARLHVSGSTGGVFEVDTSGSATTFYVSASGNVGIGTTNPVTKLAILGGDDKDTGPIISLSGNSINQFESGRIRFTEANIAASPFYQGAYVHYDGSNNVFNIGVHGNVDSLTSSDVNAISILRSNAFVGIGTTSPATTLNVSGSTRISAGELQIEGDNAAIRLYRTTGINYLDWASGQNFYLGTVTSIGGAGRSNKMVILDNGNVGIGTTNPTFLLDVSGSSRFGFTSTNTHQFTGSVNINGSLFSNANITASNISASGTSSFGYVGIGTNSPVDKLTIISGSTRIASTALAGALYFGSDTSNIYLQRDNNYDLSLVQNGDSNSALYLASAGNVYLNIDSNNNDTDKAFIVQNNALKAGTELFRVQENGSVGIGTSIPNNKLDVVGGTGTTIGLSNSDDVNRGGKLSIISGSATGRQFYVGTTSAIYNLVFGIDSIEKMRLDTSGYFAINTTNTQPYSGLFPGQLVVDTGTSAVDGIFSSTNQTNAAELILTKKNPTNNFGSLLIQHSGSLGDAITLNYNVNTSTGLGGTNSFKVTTDGNGYFRGNVGIGTTNPGAKLDLYNGSDLGSGANGIRVQRPGSYGQYGYLEYLFSSDSTILGSVYTGGGASGFGRIFFRQHSSTTSRDAMVINTDGNVGIGTTSPATKLDVKGNVFVANAAAGNNTIAFGNIGTLGPLNGAPDNLTGSAFLVVSSSTASGAPSHMKFYTTTGGTCGERMRIDSSGNVGIGTTVPAELLDIAVSTDSAGVAGPKVNFKKGSTNKAVIGIGGNYLGQATNTDDLIFRNDAGNILFGFSGAEKMRIASGGNVGIGTTNPAFLLDVSGSSRHGFTSSNTHLFTGSVSVSNNVTCLSLTETSTEAVKYNIVPLPSQLENVLKLTPVSFNYKTNNKHSIGLIAEEVAKIYPEFTSENNDSISYGKMTSVLIQSIKELKSIIDTQQKQIEELLNKFKQL